MIDSGRREGLGSRDSWFDGQLTVRVQIVHVCRCYVRVRYAMVWYSDGMIRRRSRAHGTYIRSRGMTLYKYIQYEGQVPAVSPVSRKSNHIHIRLTDTH